MIESKILKAFLLSCSYQLFDDLFLKTIPPNLNHSYTGYHLMDNQIIQLLIQSILESDEYTLEGIANYSRLPFDVIFDAACGNNKYFSITPWVKIIDLFIQVRPEVAQLLFDKILAIKDQNSQQALSLLLNEPE